MGFVYKYVDTDDDKVRYVGIVNGNEYKNLDNRINQHKKDDWHKNKKFDVYYLRTNSKTDLEFLESLFISFYRTDTCGYNISKSEWGMSDFVHPEDFEWTHYETEKDRELRKVREKRERVGQLRFVKNELKSDICRLEYENDTLRRTLIDAMNTNKVLKEMSDKSCVQVIPMFDFDVDDIKYYYKLTHNYSMCFEGATYVRDGEVLVKHRIYCVDKKIHCEHWENDYQPDRSTVFSLNEPVGCILSTLVHRHYPVRNSAYRFFYNSLMEKQKFFKIINDPKTFDDLIDELKESKKDRLSTDSIDGDIRITVNLESHGCIERVYINSKGYDYQDTVPVYEKIGKHNVIVDDKKNEMSIDQDMYEIISNAKYYSSFAQPAEEKKAKEYLLKFGISD